MTMSTSESSLPDRPRLASGLRLRPVPELETCLVYRRDPPALMMLNLSAWLLVEILGEQPDADPWPAFHEAVKHASTPQQAHEMMQQGLRQLATLGLVEPRATISGGDGR